MVWPLVCRRLEGFPNITSTQLFEELCIQFPGRFHAWQVRRLMKRVKVWRRDARARGVVIGQLKQRRVSKKPRGRGPWSSAFRGSLAGDASMPGSAAGSDGCRTPDRIPIALSRILSRQPSAYFAASSAGLAPPSHSAVDLQDARPYTRRRLWSDSLITMTHSSPD
jgi:hypothetical protein